jgi:endoglucanase
MDRRDFLQTSLTAAAAMGLAGCGALGTSLGGERFPRWRGFNLLEKFTEDLNAPYLPDDFDMISDWGFNFVRLPMSYRCWSTAEDPFAIDERVIEDVDRAVAMGRNHGIHVNLNLHRAPGYCVNPPEEPLNLWTDARAQDAFVHQWAYFADRYQGLRSRDLSFDLLNEPANIDEETYARVMRLAIDAIRSVDPERLIVVDGLRYGREPVPSLVDTGVWQSTRGYDPMLVSHFRAGWINRSDWPETVTWPVEEGGQVYDRTWLVQNVINPWIALEQIGTTVHVGEWGAFRFTPHQTALAWMRDLLELWKETGWGWALWNFRGPFGVLDSQRSDVTYRQVGDRQLDREMLRLLQSF